MTDTESTIRSPGTPRDSGPLPRPAPPFTIDLPADWVLTDHPGALFAMRLDEDPDGAWSSVVVRHMRVVRSASLEAIAQETWHAFEAGNPGAVVVDERLVRFETVHYLREIEIPQGDDVGSTTRIDSFVFGPEAGLPMVDLFLMTWLHPTEFGNRFKEIYVTMLSSMTFTQLDPQLPT